MLSGAARMFAGALGMAALFLFWAIVFPIGTMIIALYIARLIPLTGQWKRRFKR